MGECNNNSNERKRVRDDSDVDSPESKIIRVDSASSVDANSSESQLSRVNSGDSCVDSYLCELGRVDSDGSVIDSSRVNEIQDELLSMLDDTDDNVTERDVTVQGLDSGSILDPGPDLLPQSVEFNPNLGYLLEASDDELGLPPTVTPNGEEAKVESEDPGRVGPEGFDLTGFLGFEDDIRNYETFGLGNGVVYDGYCGENGLGYVTIDGLFDYGETGDILWRSESLQAM